MVQSEWIQALVPVAQLFEMTLALRVPLGREPVAGDPDPEHDAAAYRLLQWLILSPLGPPWNSCSDNGVSSGQNGRAFGASTVLRNFQDFSRDALS
jgi:hypothetical protein